MTSAVRVRVPAKVNLALRVGAADPQGYHELGTVFQAVSLYDDVTVETVDPGTDGDLTVVVTGEGAGEVPDEPAAFALPNEMSTPDEIRSGWAALETNLLGGYARLVASSDEEGWRTAMLTQVGPVQSVGGRLGFWPGWTA